MAKNSFLFLDDKVILWLQDRVCEDSEALLASEPFLKLLTRCVNDLQKKNSKLVRIFGAAAPNAGDLKNLVNTFQFLTRLPVEHVIKLVPESEVFFADRSLFHNFVEHLYNYWRHFQRLIISRSTSEDADVRPNRTFNRTIEHLTDLVRNTYRDIQVNVSGKYPRIYRQVSAGAELAAITKVKHLDMPENYQAKLGSVGVIRQVLMYPPLIFDSSSNKRSGVFEQVFTNPLAGLQVDPDHWLCYPAKVGPLLVLVYFPIKAFELNFALCNLFELAAGADIQKKVDAILFFGVNPQDLVESQRDQAFFYDDNDQGLLLGVVPDQAQFGYFGYLKKLMLTLHNIFIMKNGRLPFHGAMFQLKVRDMDAKNVLIMGDTGAGKSETLEAFRAIASQDLEDIEIVADDMGSLRLDEQGQIIAYGTEIGAFVRLDDLSPGYAFGQMDRAVILNANQVNARVVIPVTDYETIMKGHRVDYILYANNYDLLASQQSAISRLETMEEALDTFRSGKVMSKGTTTTTGIVGTYFANVFGPQQFQELHEELAKTFFARMFENNLYVGEIRTQLGIPGVERTGPQIAARDLLKLMRANR
jgi:hypothetical protein